MSQKLKFIGVIPARFASSRFPGKPLVDIKGKSMIQRVYEQAARALDMVYVATDDQRIYDAVKAFNGRVVMTSPDHKSGTDRCAEAVLKAEKEQNEVWDAILNVQGDEPFIAPQQLELVKSCFEKKDTQIATLVKIIDSTDTLFDPNRPKVVISAAGEALYFSRSVIPFLRGAEEQDWLSRHTYYMHIGLYGFRRDVLHELTVLPQTSLELAESLEQLRWLENGYRIAVRVTDQESFGVDTPEDLKKILENRGLPE